MSPEAAKLELQRQAMRHGYVSEKGRGLQRLFNTIDAFIDGTAREWAEQNGSILSYIRELQQRPNGVE
jgi:hypothetical protein